MVENKREIYETMKSRNISTLDLWRILQELGFDVKKRTLQNYIDSNFVKANDDRLKKITVDIIKNQDELIKKLKNKY